MAMLSVSTKCSPIRISLSDKDVMTLTISVKNNSDEPRMASIDLDLPKDLSVDETGLTANKNAKLGEIMPGTSEEVSFDIRATHRASPKDYEALLTIFVHYRNYGSVLEKMRARTAIRVVE